MRYRTVVTELGHSPPLRPANHGAGWPAKLESNFVPAVLVSSRRPGACRGLSLSSRQHVAGTGQNGAFRSSVMIEIDTPALLRPQQKKKKKASRLGLTVAELSLPAFRCYCGFPGQAFFPGCIRSACRTRLTAPLSLHLSADVRYLYRSMMLGSGALAS